MKIISLLTDFGLRDGYAGVMKGVIWRINPDVQIIDLSHDVSPQNVLEGALTLARCAPFFPSGTVHVAVVDPGVGTERRPIAVQLGEQFFVGPDNGLITLLLERAERQNAEITVVHLDKPQYWLPEVSNVFHGRDIFAPAAAHLAAGVPLNQLGTPIHDPIRIQVARPTPITGGWRGEVNHIDSFGNLSTNLERAHLPETGQVKVRIAGRAINGLVRAFGDGTPGSLVALIDSSGHLSICVVNGSATRYLNVHAGQTVDLIASPVSAAKTQKRSSSTK